MLSRLKTSSSYSGNNLNNEFTESNPFPLTCLVRCHGPDPNSERAKYHLLNYSKHGHTTLSASGISFGIPSDTFSSEFDEDPNNASIIVVVHASIITPFLDYKNNGSNFEIPKKLISGTGIEILLENNSNIWYNAQLIDIIEARGVMEGVQKLSQKDNDTWEIGFSRGLPFADINTPNGEFSMRNVDIAGLAVLKVNLPREKWQSKLMDTLLVNAIHPPTRGTPILLIGSPFGILNPKVFLNSITHGMISNIVTDQLNEINLLLTDARVLAGYEGGVAIEKKSKRFIGMLLPPLRRKNRQQVEVGLIIPARSIKQTISKYIKSHGDELTKSNDEISRLICEAERSVVMISINNTWASGIIVSENGHIITNAHVLYPKLKDNPDITKCFVNVRIDYPFRQWIHNVKVLFVSHPCWDIAILKLPDGYEYITRELVVAEIPIKQQNLEKATSVVAIGHGIFEPSINLQPTISQGIISNVARVNERPILIQASPSIHNGSSGGLLLSLPRKSRPQFLGVLASNIQLSMNNSSSTILPSTDKNTVIHLTLAIPCEALHDINIFIATEDPHWLQQFEKEDPSATSIWGLEFTPPVYNENQQQQNHNEPKNTIKENTGKKNGLLDLIESAKSLFPRALSGHKKSKKINENKKENKSNENSEKININNNSKINKNIYSNLKSSNLCGIIDYGKFKKDNSINLRINMLNNKVISKL